MCKVGSRFAALERARASGSDELWTARSSTPDPWPASARTLMLDRITAARICRTRLSSDQLRYFACHPSFSFVEEPEVAQRGPVERLGIAANHRSKPSTVDLLETSAEVRAEPSHEDVVER